MIGNFENYWLYYTLHVLKNNNVNDNFTEDVRTFPISDFLSTLDKSFSGVPKILISN